MTAESPQTQPTLADLAGELAKREDVLEADVRNDDPLEWRDGYIRLTVQRALVPPQVLALVGQAGYSIHDVMPQGYDHYIVEIGEVTDR